jgi:hypothetical protein
MGRTQTGDPAALASRRPQAHLGRRGQRNYEAQRRATRARLQGDAGEFYHWAKVAAEVARIAPQAAMDVDVVRIIVTEEERRDT